MDGEVNGSCETVRKHVSQRFVRHAIAIGIRSVCFGGVGRRCAFGISGSCLEAVFLRIAEGMKMSRGHFSQCFVRVGG